jgi:hypothetical protein
MKNYLTIVGGLAIAIAVFLPFGSVMGLSASLWDAGADSYIWLGVAVVLIVCGFLGKKGLNYVSLILGLGAAGMAIKYKMDLGSAGATTGIAIWVMLAGGVLAVIGSVMGLMKKAA